jgi:hypothetical protein
MAQSLQCTSSGFQLDVEIPANTKATVHLPGTTKRVTESGQPLSNSFGVSILRKGEFELVVEVGSGKYAFAW